MELDSDKIESTDLKKCGDITTFLSVGKKEFFLNCGFCTYTFCELENFIQHICEEHMYQFTVPKVEESSGFAIDFEEENAVADVLSQEEYITEENDEEDSNLRNFERVEIELDETVMSDSMDVKERNFDSSMSDYGEEKDENINDSDLDYEEPEKAHNPREKIEFETHMQGLGLANFFDKKMVLAIFACFEKRPALWDTDLDVPKYTKAREKEMRQIASDVGIPKQWDAVRKLIGRLSCRLRTEMIRKKIYVSKGKEYTPLWHTDLNAFLKLRRPVAPVKDAELKKTSPPESILSVEQSLVLAETYKETPTLWNEKDITYRFSNRRREASEMLLETFNKKTGLSLTKHELSREISRLRKICSNEKKKKFYCKRQNITYKPDFEHFEHIEFLEIDVTPYECKICGKLSAGSQQNRVHEASHDGSLPFKCDICGHNFKLVSNLTVHLRRHAQDFMYNCEVCNKPIATTTELKLHMRYHTGEKPFVCEVCGNKYRSISDLKIHSDRHDKTPRYKCEVCSKAFYNRNLLKDHMVVHNKLRNKICNICSKAFSTGKHLRQHKQIHAAEKKYLCKICGKRFAQYAGLSGHVKSHNTTLVEINSKNLPPQCDE